MRPVRLTALYASPLLRAAQSAGYLAEACGVPAQTAGAPHEYDCGVLEGCSDPVSWLRYETVLVQWLRHGELDHRLDEGESFNDIHARFVPFVHDVVGRYGAAPAEVALVAHGGLFRLMLPLVLANITAQFALEMPIPSTGIIRAETRAGVLLGLDRCGLACATGG